MNFLNRVGAKAHGTHRSMTSRIQLGATLIKQRRRSTSDNCLWCGKKTNSVRSKWCSKRCRQTAFRFRKNGNFKPSLAAENDTKKIAYADPPYPGLSKKYYKNESSYDGEVNHIELINKLQTYDGWALSTSRKALRDILPLCPREAIICPWVKTHHQPISIGPGNIHEYVIVVPARYRKPGPADAFVGSVARGGDSKLMGRKPLKFINWLFEILGAAPGDMFDDLFPGSGVVSRAWGEFKRSSLFPGGRCVVPAGTTFRRSDPGDMSSGDPTATRRCVRPGRRDASFPAGPGRRDASFPARASRMATGDRGV
jgi:hypothetical protein